jgi:3',5'-cyclic AMP phosphodiesterase CpdA
MSVTQYGRLPLHEPKGKIYLFGDVHNEADKLMDVLDQIIPLITPDDHIVFLGDLVDRGPQAALTVEALVDFTRKYPDQTYFVRGNHDWMLEDYLKTGSGQWRTYLDTTLNNYKAVWGLKSIFPECIAEALLAKGYKEITSRTIPYYETAEVIGTHAPFDKIISMMSDITDYQADYADRANDPKFKHFMDRLGDDIMWTFTDENTEIPWIDKFRVCGHQPGPGKQTHPRIFKDRAFIDTGCGKGNRPLTCLVYPGKKFYQSKIVTLKL